MEDIWTHILESLQKSPVVLVELVVVTLQGWAVSFVIFVSPDKAIRNLGKLEKSSFKIMHLFLGLCYFALIFIATNWKFVLDPVSIEDVSDNAMKTLLLGSIPVGLVITIKYASAP